MRRLLLMVVLLVLAGCNLDTTASLTSTLSESPTPLILPSPTSPVVEITPVPAQTAVEQPPPAENLFQAIINNLIVPIVSFLVTFVTDAVVSLWALAWERGGAFAQVLCCIVPGGAVGLVLFARVRIWRRR